MLKSPLIALSLLLVSGCSTPQSRPLVTLPANLAQPCQPIPTRPPVMLDPERLAWEIEIVYAYRECAMRHMATVEAVKP